MFFIIMTIGRMTIGQLKLSRITIGRVTIGRMTLSRMTFIRMTFIRMTFIRMTFIRMTFIKITLIRMTLKRIYKILYPNSEQTMTLSVILGVILLFVIWLKVVEPPLVSVLKQLQNWLNTKTPLMSQFRNLPSSYYFLFFIWLKEEEERHFCYKTFIAAIWCQITENLCL